MRCCSCMSSFSLCSLRVFSSGPAASCAVQQVSLSALINYFMLPGCCCSAGNWRVVGISPCHAFPGPFPLSPHQSASRADAFSSRGWDALAIFPSSSSVPSPKPRAKPTSPHPHHLGTQREGNSRQPSRERRGRAARLLLVLLLPPRASVPRLWAMRAGAAASPGCFLPPPAGAQHLPACEPLSPDGWQLIPLLSGRCGWLSLRPPPAFIFPLSTLGGKKSQFVPCRAGWQRAPAKKKTPSRRRSAINCSLAAHVAHQQVVVRLRSLGRAGSQGTAALGVAFLPDGFLCLFSLFCSRTRRTAHKGPEISPRRADARRR